MGMETNMRLCLQKTKKPVPDTIFPGFATKVSLGDEDAKQ